MKTSNLVLIGVGGLLIIQLMRSKPPKNRGLRNNNAGNIRITKDLWVGEIPHEQNTDGTFKQFENWTYGLRAMIGLLNRYYYDWNKKTIRSIVYTYAPPSDNNYSEYYTQLVASAARLHPDQIFDFTFENVKNIVQAMTKVELGGNYVTDLEFSAAWTLWKIAPSLK